MDPEACLSILSRAAIEHERLRRTGVCCDQGCFQLSDPKAVANGFCRTFNRRFAPPPREAEAQPDSTEYLVPSSAGAVSSTAPVKGDGLAADAADASESVQQPQESAQDDAATVSPPPPAFSALPGGGGAEAVRQTFNLAARAQSAGAGQVIDIATGANESVSEDMTEATVYAKYPALLPPQQEVKWPENASGANLCQVVIKLHEERVQVHRSYDAAFLHLLNGKGGGSRAVAQLYPAVVAKATSRFQSLSSLAMKAAETLEAEAKTTPDAVDELKEAVRLIRQVQNLEKARLRLVAMYHIEQSQLHAASSIIQEMDDDDNDPTQAMQARVNELRRQIGNMAEEIEETVSELRHASVELRECM
eukprot:CAMPEP_0206582238 /NCGR_PEP_ID=MMETSP0325_2-20121206/34346_1 /ASSEMBLY_ACC=CAM_ASM_000347 /TAXON_ID=2866 /ORGANISM="Crypthecodinium cohnii, Strain Seligo" /LENGTH=362 /DNA_ID=CAMNT_0054088843 /DNA_START=36 /DNA_END=1124 /DNA_ORIENTATION=+